MPGKNFPIVGLGASAGGLEALGEFFRHTPPDSGMAFVVVTHQHPGHTSLLPELLRKFTAMPVTEAGNNLRVKPNCIYVARPEGYLAMLNGKLQLMDSKETTAVRLPIDYFFRSLAEDQRERAVGVILSGTASDGTLGVKAIKGATGMTMAQEPESAKYPGMPRSAIATGLVDYVLPASKLPQRLLAYAKGPYLVTPVVDAHADVPNLVHELRVHQAELEMQNEELRRVQLELETSRDRFAQLYNLSPLGYLTLAADGAVYEANLTAARLLGLARRGLLKQKLSRFVAAQSQDEFYLYCRQVFATAGPQTCELQMRRSHGAAFICRLEGVLEPGTPGQPAKCLVALSDVTGRLAEVEKARLAAIVDSSDDAIISRDLDDIILTWNAGAEKIFGYSAAEMVGRSYAVLVPPERRKELRQLRVRIKQGEIVAHFDTVRVAKDGRHIVVSSASSPIKDADGKLVGISAILRDVTTQQLAEETLRRSEAALEDFFTEAPLGLLWVGADARILRVNRAQLQMLGCASEEVYGRPVAEFLADPKATAVALDRLAEQEILTNHRALLRRKDGSTRHVLIDANGLWSQGRLLHSRWFVRDITTRIELQTELLQISERERQRIGHDLHDSLGQQLHGLSYLAELLAKRLREEASPHAAEIFQLNKYLGQALELTRSLAHGLQPVKRVPEGLTLALRELATRARELYRVDCRFECRVPVPIHRPDAATHLYRIAQEAVNNAMKHAKPTRISIQLASTPARIILGIRDNGVGIRQQKHPAKGMGMHIMRYRADAIGGSLIVQKLPRRGTEVVCTVKRQDLLPAGGEAT